ncbi:hypothetical protein [Microseira sp. BLCC-F43]|jgi:hypothetical protein|uniref:hypothetical protein n=1 Tax=Microseira sp. BLCC-F43 TaxID=3153602 RepID=UPI0035BACF26
MLNRRNLLPLKLIVTLISCILIFQLPVKALTKQDFYSLLPAYEKARLRYSLARDLFQLGQNYEEIYWMEQYNFYPERLENILNEYERAARNKPRSYCLPALELYHKYNTVNSSVPFVGGLDTSMWSSDI